MVRSRSRSTARCGRTMRRKLMISCFASEMSRTISDELALEDVVLEAIELDRHLAQHRERRIDAGVDDLVEEVAGALREGCLAQVILLAVALEHRGQGRERDARQRDQVVGAHEQVELGGQDPAGLLLEQRELEDDEDVVVVLVELGPVVARVDVLVVERVEVEVAPRASRGRPSAATRCGSSGCRPPR